MTAPIQQVRRATIEDLPQLGVLWSQENLPAIELEKRLKEFQVVEGPDGQILGTFGLQVTGTDGVIHSEAFQHPQQADELRGRLWDRAQVVIKNHGLARVWVQSPSAFWLHQSFQQAPAEVLTKLPPDCPANHRPWLFRQLRDDNPALSIDKEFALFRETERESTERLFRQAKIMKIVAAVIAVGLLILVVIWAFSLFKVQGKIRPR